MHSVFTETNIKCPCGGYIEIKDWSELDDDLDPEFRYEARCDTCLTCDPNGYRTLADTVLGAYEHFNT